MDSKSHHEARELSAQELTEVSGGVYDPNHTEKPADGTYQITGGDHSPVNHIDVKGLVDQKIKSYSDQYGYPKYGNDSESY
jgi:hypothetical protein